MKNMQKFAAQQLTKKQMIVIKGGAVAIGCTIKNQDGGLVSMREVFRGETLSEAMDNMYKSIGNNNAFDCKVWTE